MPTPTRRLTPPQVAEIRRRAALGESQHSIARSFGIGQGTVSKIHLGERHTRELRKAPPVRSLPDDTLRRLRECWCEGEMTLEQLSSRFGMSHVTIKKNCHGLPRAGRIIDAQAGGRQRSVQVSGGAR